MSGFREVFKRAEIKYLLSSTQAERLMFYLNRIARVDQYGVSRICNIYFDTLDYRLIRTSIEKPLYKEKLRLRTYGLAADGSDSFIEIKKKYAGIVYKRRICGQYAETYGFLTDGTGTIADSQVGDEIRTFLETYEGLRPAMRIDYDRVAMAGIEDPDFRVTFDTNVRWSTSHMDLREACEGSPILAPGQVLMEIKIADAMPMELAEILSRLAIFPSSFSKYGRGYAELVRPETRHRDPRGEIIRYVTKENSGFKKGVAAYV